MFFSTIIALANFLSTAFLAFFPMVIASSIFSKLHNIWLEMSLRVKQATRMLKEVLNAEGVNIGMNLSKAAGAGIAEHVHYHVLPRWLGDTNFISSIGNTRVYPVDFDKIYKKLKEHSPKYFI